MISVNVLVDHKKWKKSLNKPQLFFDKILKRFPKKYFYSNKNVNFIYDENGMHNESSWATALLKIFLNL